MGRFKRTKQKSNPLSREVARLKDPVSRVVSQKEAPNKYHDKHPSWKFHLRDNFNWAFSKENVGDEFWNRILEHLHNWETQTWNDILVIDYEHNHPIEICNLNKVAIDRLQQLYIESESIISLRLSNTHRLYGIMDESSFCIIWFDNNHGDNDTCVCRSHKKHT